MTTTKFYLFDSRLKAGRSIEIQVHFSLIVSEHPRQKSVLVRYVKLATDIARSEPLEIELTQGVWKLEFNSYIGDRVSYILPISSTNETHSIDAALLDSDLSTVRYKPLTTGNIGYEYLNDSQPRRLVPSRENKKYSPSIGARKFYNQPANKPHISANVFEFSGFQLPGDEVFPKQFVINDSFEQKFNFWFQNWKSVQVETNVHFDIETIPNTQLFTTKLKVPICFELGRKTVLTVNFTDERYLLSIPHLEDKVNREPRTIDVEIDFFDLPKTSTRGRISKVRILTDNAALNGIIQLLSAGQLDQASTLWSNNTQQAFQDNFACPVTAAAGALALVQPEILSSLEHDRLISTWHRLHDMDLKFEWIPDLTICRAWMLNQSNVADLSEIKNPIELKNAIAQYMIKATQKGAPIYFEGVNLLSQAVEWTANEVGGNMRVAVDWLASHSINASPFLMLRDQFKGD